MVVLQSVHTEPYSYGCTYGWGWGNQKERDPDYEVDEVYSEFVCSPGVGLSSSGMLIVQLKDYMGEDSECVVTGLPA